MSSICNFGVMQLTTRPHAASGSHKPSKETTGFIDSLGGGEGGRQGIVVVAGGCRGCRACVVVVVVVVGWLMSL
jgi:hypothetical protein